MVQRKSFRKNAYDLSPEINHLAKIEELGELCKIYPVSKRYTSIWVLGQVCLAWAILVPIFTASIIAALLFSSRPLSLTSIFAVAVSELLLLIAGCYMSFSRRIYELWQVSLWQNGFIYEKKQIRQAFRWNRIESVQACVAHTSNGPAPIVYTCNVRRQDGYKVMLTVFSDLSELIDVVLEESAYQFAPRELNIVPQKNIRMFTALKLDRQGIGNEQETLSWQEIQDFMTKNGTVTLRKKEE